MAFGDALGGAGQGAATGAAFGPWGAAIGAGLGALGGIAGAGAQKKAEKKYKKKVDFAYGQAGGLQTLANIQQQQLLQASLLGIQQAYDQAAKQVSQGQAQATQQAQQAGTQMSGAATMALANAGLANTSLMGGAQASVAAQQAQQFGQINAQAAQMIGGLGIEKAGAESQIKAALGELAQQNYAQKQGLLFGQYGAKYGVPGPGQVPQGMLGPPQMQGIDFGSIGALLGNIPWGSFGGGGTKMGMSNSPGALGPGVFGPPAINQWYPEWQQDN